MYLPCISPERDDLVREARGGAARRPDLQQVRVRARIRVRARVRVRARARINVRVRSRCRATVRDGVRARARARVRGRVRVRWADPASRASSKPASFTAPG